MRCHPRTAYTLIHSEGILCRLRADPALSLFPEPHAYRLPPTVWLVAELVGPEGSRTRRAGCDSRVAQSEEETGHPL